MASIVLMTVAASVATCDPSAATNRQIVADFYRQALIDKQPVTAFDRYMAPDFIEHKPDVAGGTRAGAAAFLGGIIEAVPEAKWEILRIVAEGDLVALHARMTPAPNAQAYAIGDFFRLKDCKIVEHWDAVGGPVDDSKNPNPRF